MSAAEILAELPSLTDSERAQIAEQSLRKVDPVLHKLVERQLRRIAHPDVPEEFWEGLEDMEDGRTVDMQTALFEEPPPWVLDRTLPRP